MKGAIPRAMKMHVLGTGQFAGRTRVRHRFKLHIADDRDNWFAWERNAKTMFRLRGRITDQSCKPGRVRCIDDRRHLQCYYFGLTCNNG